MPEPPDRDAVIFPVDTRFQQLARRPGGVSRDRALQGAQRHIEEMKSGFNTWLANQLNELAAAVQFVDRNPRDPAGLDRAYEACRQLRDVGGTMGYELVTFVASNFCDIIDAIKAGAAYDKNMIDCHMDALALARTDGYRGLLPEQVPEMTMGLRRVAERATASLLREGK